MGKIRLPWLNEVYLTGRLTDDPGLKYLPTGNHAPVLNFRLASTHHAKHRSTGRVTEHTVIVPCTAYGGYAVAIAERCQKGSHLHIQGHLRFAELETKTGKRGWLSVQVERMQFLDILPIDKEAKRPYT